MTVASDKRITEEQRKVKENEDKIRARKAAELKKDLCATFATDHGKRTLRWLMDQCNYQKPIIVADPRSGETLNTTLYAEGRRTLYLRLRSYLHRDILEQVEQDAQEGADGSEELLT